MNILLWVLQVLLALVFFAHGMLLLMPPPDIQAQMHAALPPAKTMIAWRKRGAFSVQPAMTSAITTMLV